MHSRSPEEGGARAGRAAGVGLCLECRHSRRVPTPRATYWLCELAASDPRFDKYPRLPVLECPGYEPREERRERL